MLSLCIEVSGSGGKERRSDASGFDACLLDDGDEVYHQFRLRSHGETSKVAALAVLHPVEAVSQ